MRLAQGIRPLVPSACLIEDLPGDAAVYEAVSLARATLHKAVRGRDDRLIVVAGPAAIHDPEAAMEALGGDEFIFDVQGHYVNPDGAWVSRARVVS